MKTPKGNEVRIGLQDIYADCLADDSHASRITTSDFIVMLVEDASDLTAQLAEAQATIERLKGALEYLIVLDNLYVGEDFTGFPKGSDGAHVRDIWRQGMETVDGVLNYHPESAQPTAPQKEDADGTS